jgi:3',5'-cyclic AMP phosphodiesterase CpdA
MLIAQISDLHIAAPGKQAFGIAPTAENLVRSIDHINQLNPAPDLVLVTGDLVNYGTAEETRRARSLLEKLQFPCFIVPGNHDDREILWDSFGEKAIPSRFESFFNYVIKGHDIRLIALDSTAPGQPGGHICTRRAAWLDGQLAQAEGQPVIIFMHHPPLKCSVLETDEDGFTGADRLGQVVEKYRNIERILCGHIHLVTHASWRGTIVSTAPSMGLQLGLDLTMTRESEFYKEAPGYLLHHWTAQQDLITHSISVRDLDGPYLFEEQ